MIEARGRCGERPLGDVARVEHDDVGPFVALKSVVRSASSSVALLKVRRCPHALARHAGPVVRVARRTHSGLQSLAEASPGASAGLVDLVELAHREIDHVHDVMRREASGNE